MEDILLCGSHDNFDEIIDYSLHCVGVCQKKKRSEWRTNMRRAKQTSNSWKLSLSLWIQHLHFLGFDEKEGDIRKYEISRNAVSRLYQLQYSAIDELEQQLENIESGKGYLKLDDHEEKIQETKDYFRQENASLKDDMIKYKNEVEFLRDKMECMEQTHRNLMETKDKTIKCLEHDLFEDKK
tara:strand:+ start:3364 stop:3909 length:546 start_codon:yes stop_codon:yes gene_type:complete